jgi:hypothetical protein
MFSLLPAPQIGSGAKAIAGDTEQRGEMDFKLLHTLINRRATQRNSSKQLFSSFTRQGALFLPLGLSRNPTSLCHQGDD